MAVGRFGISVFLITARVALAQTPGTLTEVHPKLTTYTCTLDGGCQNQTSALVLDSNLHPVHQLVDTSLPCGSTGSAPNVTVCPNVTACQENCIIEGISKYWKYGVKTRGDALKLRQVPYQGPLSANSLSSPLRGRTTGVTSLHPRVYLLEPNETEYQQFFLDGNGLEIAFDVDVSRLPCGMNGALHLVEMDPTGGQSTLNTGGVTYGTGYCDARCTVYPFIEGVGNIGGQGSCCNEIGLWEANARATQLSARSCAVPGLFKCTGYECSDPGVCSETGCKQNPYALGYEKFYGENLTVNTSQPFTVITRFIEERGCLVAIQRAYYQDGIFIPNRCLTRDRGRSHGLTNGYCRDEGFDRYLQLGGNKGVGEALGRGMVLAASIWWDNDTFLNDLDSGDNGPCGPAEGDPDNIVAVEPHPKVTFSNIRWGELGSTLASIGQPPEVMEMCGT